jgi:hypothetical protein
MSEFVSVLGNAEQKENQGGSEKQRSFVRERNRLLELVPFNLQGNKAALLTNGLGQLVLAAAQSSERVIDAFAGTGLYTHYIRDNGIDRPTVVNEYDPFRFITHQQLRDNPVGVVLAVEYYVRRLSKIIERFNAGDSFGPEAKAAQAEVANFFQQQAERLAEPRQNISDLASKKAPVKMKSTPELAGLYLVMQNQVYANRSIQADATSRGLMKIMTRAEVMTIVNDGGKVKKFRLGRKYLFNSRERFLSVHNRLRKVTIMNRDAWSLIQEIASAGDFVLVDSSYLGEKTSNYNKATNEDRKADVYERKFRECILPAMGRGAKFLITNNWNEGVVDLLKKFGFRILRLNRARGVSVDTAEFAAFNFNPSTGINDGSPPAVGQREAA